MSMFRVAAVGIHNDKIVFLLLVLAGVLSTPQRDYGESYGWKSFSEGMNAVEREQKPGIVVIAKRFSGACKEFAKSMASGDEMIRLSSHFVMILALDEDEPQEEKWLPGLFIDVV